MDTSDSDTAMATVVLDSVPLEELAAKARLGESSLS